MTLRIDSSVKVKTDSAGYVKCWKTLVDEDGELTSTFWANYTWQKGTWHEPKPNYCQEEKGIIAGGALHVWLEKEGSTVDYFLGRNEAYYRCVFHISDLIATGWWGVTSDLFPTCAAVSRLYLIEKVED